MADDPSLGEARGLPRSPARTAQFIYLALMAGLAIFGIVVALSPMGEGPAVDGSGPSVGFLIAIAAALTATMAIPAVLFGGRAVRRSAGAPGIPSPQRMQRYIAGKLTVAALIEGPGLIWGVIALLSGEILPLAGVAFSIFLLGVVFPRLEEYRDATGLR